MADTSYLVLRKNDEGAWEELDGSFLASSGAAAVRLAAESEGKEGKSAAELVPVPTRSWTPMKVVWESTPSLRVTRSTATTNVTGGGGVLVGGNAGTNG